LTRFSVVIPTYRRREIVLRHVAALEKQTFRDFEAVVVDDGSGDGTAAALRALTVGFPLTVVEQENGGSAAARNAGARAAGGEILLFLDDDMEADLELLAQHERSHRDGAEMVIGDLPIHPDSPPGLLSWGVGVWTETRRERLTRPGAEPGLDDFLTGQISIGREAFDRLGGFDTSFTREGLFGGEDIDFGYRALKAGLKIVFEPEARSYQYYEVDADTYLRRSWETGRSEEELVLKHPEQASRFEAAPSFHTRTARWLLGPLVYVPDLTIWPLRRGLVALVRRGHRGPMVGRLFFSLRTLEHKRGARSARRAQRSGQAVVLAYHAVSDLTDDPVLAEYGVPPQRLAAHLDALARGGRTAIDLDTLLAALDGRAKLPKRAFLITFDDCYTDLLDAGSDVLRERSLPALAFAVAGLTGASNEWDRPLGARRLPLLDGEGLRELTARGIEIGSHAMTHRPLARLAPAEAAAEAEESAAELARMELPRPRALSYPHGECNPATEAAVRDAGYAVAFTVTTGVIDASANRYALPRIEVLASDSPARLRLKIATADWPPRLRRRILRLTRTRE
jgi:GT2 family glycosyltransferase/peptidoglycan/xylan/chitin deacetylase (PgdA/CDA1 family)